MSGEQIYQWSVPHLKIPLHTEEGMGKFASITWPWQLSWYAMVFLLQE